MSDSHPKQKHPRFTLALGCLFTLLLAAQAGSEPVEESGQIIHQLISEVREGKATMEADLARIRNESAPLEKELEAKVSEFRSTSDPDRQFVLRSEIGVTLAKLNKKDREQVQVLLGVIADVTPKMTRLKEEIKKVANAGRTNSRDYELWRDDLAEMLHSTVTVTDEIRKWLPGFSPQDKQAMDEIDQSISIMWQMLANGSELGEPSLGVLERQIARLAGVFTKMKALNTLLEQERLVQVLENYILLTDAITTFVGTGFEDVGDLTTQVSSSIGTRKVAMEATRVSTAARVGTTLQSTARDREVRDIIRRRAWPWLASSGQ